MKLHPRHKDVRNAENELAQWLMGWQENFGLTASEYVNLLSAEVTRFTASLVVQERKEDER